MAAHSRRHRDARPSVQKKDTATKAARRRTAAKLHVQPHWLTNKLAQALHCAVAVATLSLPLLPLAMVVSVALPLPIVTLDVSPQPPQPLLATHQPVMVLAMVVPHMPQLAVVVSFLPVVGVGGI